MPRKSIGATAMTDADPRIKSGDQARYRAAHSKGAPVIRTRRPADHPPPSQGQAPPRAAVARHPPPSQGQALPS